MCNKIYHGDCIEKLKELPSNSIDSIVTDPPYDLTKPTYGFERGKQDNPFGRTVKGGFMGKEWDGTGIAFKVELWKEVLRVLKPGGYLLSFGGSRTYHRMACAIEDAGFEIRDMIEWLYGSGFPKSLNIGKQIDKMAYKNKEVIIAKKELGKWLKEKRGDKPQKEIAKYFLSKTGGLTGCVANWEKGYNLPTWSIWVKLKEILNLDNKFDYLIEGRPNEYIEAEREVIGKQNYTVPKEVYNIGENKSGERDESLITAPATDEAKKYDGWGTALKPAHEPIVVARKPLSEKNVALNVLKHGTGGINIDESRIVFKNKEDFEESVNKNKHADFNSNNGIRCPTKGIYHGDFRHPENYNPTSGRFPANLILECTCDELFGLNELESDRVGVVKDKSVIHTDPNCPCYMLDKQSGLSQGSTTTKVGKVYGETSGRSYLETKEHGININDKGGASRFFYQAKASKSERNAGLEEFEDVNGIRSNAPRKNEETKNKLSKNNHPTVKPIKLMEYLVKLVTPKGGVCLDPFLGSGTTAIACVKNGFNYIGIEREEEYVKIAEARLKPYLEQKKLDTGDTDEIN